MNQPIELIIGITFFILGLSLLFHQRKWTALINDILAKGPSAILMIGAADVLMGSFIISFHWVWSGLSTITTIVGALFLLRGTVRLLCPKMVVKRLKSMMRHATKTLWISGLTVIVLSWIILCNWWQISYGVNIATTKSETVNELKD